MFWSIDTSIISSIKYIMLYLVGHNTFNNNMHLFIVLLYFMFIAVFVS